MNRTVFVELRARVSNYVAGFKQAAQATSDLAGKAGKAVQENSAEISRMGTGFMVTGAGMLAVAGKATKTFADFDKAMSGVAATGDDAKSRLGELRTLAVDLGADTQYSAQEAAAGITNLIKAGVSAEDVIGGGLAGALSLAAAGEMEVADAAETTAITLAQFKLRGDQAAHVADLLAAGAGKASGEVSDMAQALSQVGLVANQTGLSVEETTGALAAFGQAGLIGSDAGTSLKTMLQRLTPQSAAAQKQFDALGISAYDANGEFVGLANFAGQLETKLGELSPQARAAAMGIMFGSDAIRAANVLYEQGADGIQGWIDAVDDQGFATRQAAELTNNLAGDVERLGGSLDSVFIKSGSGANNVLRSMVQGAEAAVDAFGGLPEPLLATMTLLTGSGGIAAVGVGGLLKLASAAADAKTSFQSLNMSAKAAKITVAGVGGALAIGTLALAAWASAAADAQARTDGFASTLTVVDGQAVRTKATTAELTRQLTETRVGLLSWAGVGNTVADNLDRMGISSKTAAEAIMGQEDAQKQLNDQMRAWANANRDVHGHDPQMYRETKSAIDSMTGSLTEAERRTEQKAKADEEASGSAGNLSSALRDQRTGADSAADSIQKVTEAIYAMQDANIAAANSEVSFEQAIDDSAAAVKKLAKATRDKKQLQDVDTQAGRDATKVLTGLATATNQRVKDLIKQGKSEADIAATMERGRKAFANRARDLGYNEKQIQELIATYLQVPENVTTDVNEQGAEGAAQRVLKLQERLKDLPESERTRILSEFNNKGITAAETALRKIDGKTATATVTTIYKTKGGTPFQADGGVLGSSLGGLVQQFASGGFGLPQVRAFQGSAGVNWGEDGSGPWEAFISGAPQKRNRSIAIWREVGRRLLGSISAEDLIDQFANGGIKEPTHKGRPLSFWENELKSPLELTRLKIRIRDLERDLKEKESYTVGKGKKKKKRSRLKLRGLDRTEAKQDLAETRAEYALAVEADRLNRSKQGTIEKQIAAFEARKEAAEEAEKRAQDVADEARQQADRLKNPFMTGASAADLLANMQAGAQQINQFNDLMGQLDKGGMSDAMIDWFWEQGVGSSQIAKDILAGGKSSIDLFNAAVGNLDKASAAAGKAAATGTPVASPALTRVDVPGYLQSGPNGPAVGQKTVNFHITQSDPQAVAVAVDQKLRYL